MIADFILNDNFRTLMVFVISFFLVWVVTKRPRDLPPGPALTLPILGDVLRMGKDQLLWYRQMREKHGDIFSFYIGNRLLIVLNGYTVIKKALLKESFVFSERPHLFMMDEICEGKGIVATSGDLWKEQRLFAQTTLRMLGSGRHIMEESIQREATALISAIEQQNETFDPHNVITTAVSNIMCNLCFGKRYDYDDPEFLAYLIAIEKSFKAFKSTQVLNFFPALKYIPGDLFMYKRMMYYKKFVEDNFLLPNIKRIANALRFDVDPKDYTTAYLLAMREKKLMGWPTTMDDLNLKQSIGNIFSGGTESTTESIRWAILYFMKFPDVQEKCFQEIKQNIGLSHQPSMKDRANVPYVDATIMEILRHCDVAPLAVAHAVPFDIIFMDYRIPKEAIVIPNLDSVLKDTRIWSDPDVFRPERFLDEGGKVFKPEEFIPFSLGRRLCPGEAIAQMELFLFISSLIQKFQFVPPQGAQLCLKGVLGLTQGPVPYKARFIRRH